MGVKDISKTMTLKDMVTSPLNKISAGTVRYKKNLQNLKDQGNDTWDSLKTGIGVLGGVAAGYLSVSAAASFLSGAAEEARLATEADTKLAAVLQNVKGVTDSQVESIKTYAQELENVGVVGGDVVTSGIQQAGTFQLQAETLKTLMPGMADLLAQQKGVNASQGDAVSIGNLLGKSMTGQVGALSKVGISFTAAQKKILQYGTEQAKAATLAEVLQANVGGVNKALAATDSGKIVQANNAWGAQKEIIGGVVLQIKAGLAGAFMTHLPQIQTGIEGITDRVSAWTEDGGIDRMINGVESVWNGIKSVWGVSVDTYNFFKDNWSLIGPIIYGVAASLAVYKIVAMSASVWTALFGSQATFAAIRTSALGIASLVASGQLGVMAAAQRVLNAAWAANPIGVIITLLGLLVLAGTYVVKNWETVKLAGMNTWNVLVGAVQWGVNKHIDFANFMLKVYKFAWDSIEFGGKSIWNGILSAGQSGVNSLIGLINSMVEKSLDGINVLIRGANSASEKLGFGKALNELTFGGLNQVNLDQFKVDVQMPKWDNALTVLPQVDFSKAKFSDDAVMAQVQKSKQEQEAKKPKSEDKLAGALEANTAAIAANTSATGANTTATGKNTDKLKENQSPLDLADTLLGRIERHMYGT